MHSKDKKPTSRRIKKRIAGIDLFCGAGGLTRGLREAGIDVILGVDAEEDFKETYEKNNKGASFWARNIETVTGKELSKFLNLKSSEKFLLAACAPCQPFSTQNKKRLEEDFSDDRKNLLKEVIRIIKEMPRKPDFIFAENVPGIERNPVFVEFENYLHSLEYSVAFGVVNAADFGVPQSRKRLILIACKDGFIAMPKPMRGKGLEPYVTVRDAFKGLPLPPIQAGGRSSKIPNHSCRNLSDLNLKRIKTVRKNGGSRSAFSGNLILDCHKKSSGHKDVYGRMAWDKPAPTLTTRCVSITNGRFGHPTQNRAISIREAARIQSFPDDYIFYGASIDTQARQVGNAVPVKLAEAFGRQLINSR